MPKYTAAVSVSYNLANHIYIWLYRMPSVNCFPLDSLTDVVRNLKVLFYKVVLKYYYDKVYIWLEKLKLLKA